MALAVDIPMGTRFGLLTVLGQSDQRIDRHIAFRCKCDCGNYSTVRGTYLRSGHTKSCGCKAGGRPIKITDRFANFLVDMGPRPRGRTIDRHPDKNGNYEPGNCRWATALQQQRNRRPRRKRA